MKGQDDGRTGAGEVVGEAAKGGGALVCRRRSFLLGGAAATVTVMIAPFPWQREAHAAEAKVKSYPRTRIGSLSGLSEGAPVGFHYPAGASVHAQCFLVKLGTKAGAGVGPTGDVVAFSALCTHMGGLLSGTYKAEHKVMGPCPVHLTTFDLTRHGIVVAGHATESLPQILLETDGDDIYATGVMGLTFGRPSNL
jgi:arsenite oxidase small subunit